MLVTLVVRPLLIPNGSLQRLTVFINCKTLSFFKFFLVDYLQTALRDTAGFTVQSGTLSSVPDENYLSPVETIVVHPDYIHDEYLGVPNDLAVLKVSTAFVNDVSIANFSWSLHSILVKPFNQLHYLPLTLACL